MNEKALFKLTYGVHVITSKKGDRINGQIANTAIQIAYDPITITVSINKNNLTHEYIKDSRTFAVSVVGQDAPLSLIGQFGFKSGRDVDKFEGINYKLTPNGVPYVTDYTLSYMEAEVLQEVDAGTHTIFIGKVIGAEVLQEGTPMTYAYYHEIKRGSVPKTAPTYSALKEPKRVSEKYVCSVCGYTYDPELGDPDGGIAPGTAFADLPEDWVCPVCGAGKGDFEKA
ncbi:High molecular weight rubredoxin [Pelotomaculum sp. FP]|uniref:rubredoxin n=1 Tax=Pelotomaculum sp. FP TaxID=261474 RepID=UPI001065A782|nr:flavin reductase [Pelotomaculum sp. FP]TEB16182.1 High molecular weight rubredoxin [Pelotomaculum sp. FP]